MIKHEDTVDLSNKIYHEIQIRFPNAHIRSKLHQINVTNSEVDEIELRISFDSRPEYKIDRYDVLVLIRIELQREVFNQWVREVLAIMNLPYNEDCKIESLVKQYKDLMPHFAIREEMFFGNSYDGQITRDKTVEFVFNVPTDTQVDKIAQVTKECVSAFSHIYNKMNLPPKVL